MVPFEGSKVPLSAAVIRPEGNRIGYRRFAQLWERGIQSLEGFRGLFTVYWSLRACEQWTRFVVSR